MLEVLVNAVQQIKKGDEMTVNYMNGQMNKFFIQRYGFSSPVNPWDVIQFSGHSRVHLDSFLSVFNISGLPKEYYHNRIYYQVNYLVMGIPLLMEQSLQLQEHCPPATWSDGDIPHIPSLERKAVKELQEECQQMLAEFSQPQGKISKLLSRCLRLGGLWRP